MQRRGSRTKTSILEAGAWTQVWQEAESEGWLWVGLGIKAGPVIDST